MTSRYRTTLMFSVSSNDVMAQLEQEFSHHSDVTTDTSFDEESFILTVECPDTPRTVWEVRIVVLTFDADSSVRRQISPPGGAYDPTAA